MTMSYYLISWGANSHGQLGQGIRSEECILPNEVDLSKCSLEPQKINKIVGGAGHTLILDDYGHVYSCGWNNKGQTGFPMTEDILSFRKLNGKLKEKVVLDIACGWDCSAALTIDGTLFLWGSNCFGQLGKEPNTLQWTCEPFEVVTNRKFKRISMGLRHTALITEDHKILVAGTGSKGQLGLGSSTNVAHTFTEVTTLTNIEDVSCGQHHTIAKANDGDLYVFGDNKHGQLGVNVDVISRTSIPIKLSNPQFKLPIKIHSGWSHVIVVNEDNKILCWGWNEHGNCGNGDRKDVKFPEQLLLPYDYTGILVGSGAGHSFAVIKKS
ncbi:secretion regulating guanine nucleotide exchange factor isoform X2 [Xylocopa sonorina]|uniref:secretion regulating guanine nucleotide exchange factor isoform X2 n=1 Tax=Xylocopa sonorina TaxID=1818115 RepID=UPI00403A8B40